MVAALQFRGVAITQPARCEIATTFVRIFATGQHFEGQFLPCDQKNPQPMSDLWLRALRLQMSGCRDNRCAVIGWIAALSPATRKRKIGKLFIGGTRTERATLMNNDFSTIGSDPAVLGGTPVFAEKVPIVRPVLPKFDALADDMAEIVGSGMVTKGKHLRALEQAAAEHLQVRHAVAVSSCTSGLMLTYQALGLTGDVVVPSFTFMATVSSMIWAGLRPVFADVDYGTTNLDPARAEEAITPNTSAIVAVHNFGNPADIAALKDLAERRGLKLIFDAAHGFGCRYEGRPVGGQADAQVYSLSPTKLVIAAEGGIVATNDDALAEHIRIGREYGMSDYDSRFAGLNSRMSEFSALLGCRSLALLEPGILRRQEVSEIFRRELGDFPGIDFQAVRPVDRCSYKDFSITVEESAFGLSRDQLRAAMEAENIDTRRYYTPPVHRQQAYREFAPAEESLSNTNVLSQRCLSLPIWSRMDDEVVLGICQAVRRIHGSIGKVAAAM